MGRKDFLVKWRKAFLFDWEKGSIRQGITSGWAVGGNVWFDEETVSKICLIESIFLGDGSIPQTPLLGETVSPRPPQ
jgi:hypothetical protein